MHLDESGHHNQWQLLHCIHCSVFARLDVISRSTTSWAHENFPSSPGVNADSSGLYAECEAKRLGPVLAWRTARRPPPDALCIADLRHLRLLVHPRSGPCCVVIHVAVDRMDVLSCGDILFLCLVLEHRSELECNVANALDVGHAHDLNYSSR